MPIDKDDYVGRCPFCSIGDKDKRGVIVTAKEMREDRAIGEASKMLKPVYKCGVGQTECIIPTSYHMGAMEHFFDQTQLREFMEKESKK